MVRKTFLIFLSAEILIIAFGLAIKHFQPKATGPENLDDFPLQKNGWIGVKDDLIPEFVDMLNPTLIFSATYTNGRGSSVHLFFDYFEGQSNPGGPHSPRNCMPGSGWIIADEGKSEIQIAGRKVKVGKFGIRLGDSKKVMDFWYLTRYGETANDYIFKFYTMISSLTFRPNDVVFIRILAEDDADGRAALEEFEHLFVGEIYDHLGFK